MKYILILLFFLVSLSSCHTIQFSKTSQYPPQEYQFTNWHHIFLLGLFEFSDPVNLKEICSEKGDWSSVRVQTGFFQVLVRSFPLFLLPIPIPAGIIKTTTSLLLPYSEGFYSPEEVSIQCVAGSSSLN